VKKRTKETIIRNIPTPALVLVICEMEANNEEALPTKAETSSVKPLLINLAEFADISANSFVEILKASVIKPVAKVITPRTRTTPASVRTKSLAVIADIFPPGKYYSLRMLQLICHQIICKALHQGANQPMRFFLRRKKVLPFEWRCLIHGYCLASYS
jgi:hypothetical protein